MLVLLFGIVGIFILHSGLNTWKKRTERQDELEKEELRKRSANADIAEKEAEQLEREANAAKTGKVTIDGEEYTIEEWEK